MQVKQDIHVVIEDYITQTKCTNILQIHVLVLSFHIICCLFPTVKKTTQLRSLYHVGFIRIVYVPFPYSLQCNKA